MQITHAGHLCTPILSQRLFFALFIGNTLGGVFHLWHVESNVHFSQKQAEMLIHLATVFRSISDHFGPRKLGGISAQNF